MDRIKVELTHALVSVDRARNHYRDHGCDNQLPYLILDAQEHVTAARDAILARLRYTKRPDYLPDDDYPDLIPLPANECPACATNARRVIGTFAEHSCGVW